MRVGVKPQEEAVTAHRRYGVRTRIILVTVTLLLYPHLASARLIEQICEVIDDVSGATMHRVVTIDTESRTVHDNAMTFQDGATSPLASNLEEFVEIDGARATWGNRTRAGRLGAGVFTLDLASGDYLFTSRIRGRLSHGTCQQSKTLA